MSQVVSVIPSDPSAGIPIELRRLLMCQPRLVAFSNPSTEYTWTSTTPADIVTLSGLNIDGESKIVISYLWRRAADGANSAYIGLKINSTVVNEADGTYYICNGGPNGAAVSGFGEVTISGGRGAVGSNYIGTTPKSSLAVSFYISGVTGQVSRGIGGSNAMPTAEITSIALRGANSAGATITGIQCVKIWEFPSPGFTLP